MEKLIKKDTEKDLKKGTFWTSRKEAVIPKEENFDGKKLEELERKTAMLLDDIKNYNIPPAEFLEKWGKEMKQFFKTAKVKNNYFGVLR